MQSNPTEFLKEATIMHNIEHEHIVRLYGVVLDTNALMLVRGGRRLTGGSWRRRATRRAAALQKQEICRAFIVD